MSREISKSTGQAFIKVPPIDINLLPNGVYHIRFLSKDKAEYRVEKEKGGWFLADGTGWKEKIPKEQKFKPLRFYEFK